MSGPIVRKYGFPNFEKIFGERGLEHGVEEAAEKPAEGGKAPEPPPTKQPDAGPKPDASAKPSS